MSGEGEGSIGGYTAISDGAGMSKAIPGAGPDTNYPASIGAHAAVGGIIIIGGAEFILGAFGLAKGVHTTWGGIHLGWEIFWEVFGHGGGHGHGDAGSSGGSSGGSSSSGGGHPSGQPVDRPFGGGIDYGGGAEEAGKESGETSSGDPPTPEPKPEPKPEPSGDPKLTNTEMTVNDETTTKGTDEPINTDLPRPSTEMPNPIDGGGEDVDKDWWRNLPDRSIVDALKPGLNVDEGIVTLPLEAIGGNSYLNSVLTPSPITVEPGGEGLILNLAGIHSQSTSSGTTTSDGWGDKPRSLAEALAAPRIRDASTSRF
jgi:hypothetical protein